MPNIAIINYCNLQCPYCFADDMIHEKSKAITLDDFRKILEWVARTPENHIGLIGGEPTLHPEFENILKECNKFCKECNTSATLFTNGINLDKFLPYIGERFGILWNLNSPKFMTNEQWKLTNETLEHIDSLSWLDDLPDRPSKVCIGCNVHPGLEDYSFLWDIVDKYKLKKVRTSVVSPGGKYTSMRNDKNAYFAKMKPIFLEHCRNAEKHKCMLNMDCGHIPSCYFTVEELELVRKVSGIRPDHDFCEPVIDITSDFKATACFGTWDTVDIRDFNNIHELRRYLMATKNVPRSLANCTGKCATCKKHELMQCQGGCLGFADPEKLKKILEVFDR